VASFNEPLYDLVHTLATTIDFEASKEFGRLTIKEGVCPSLDELRYDGILPFIPNYVFEPFLLPH
jgi:hypothetical protein